MDGKDSLQTPQVPTPPVDAGVQSDPVTQATSTDPAMSGENNNVSPTPVAGDNHKPLIVTSFVFAGLILGGFFVYITGMNDFPFKQKSYSKTPNTIPSPIASPLPTVDPKTDSALESESGYLDQDIDQVEKSFLEVDQGLNDRQGDLSE